MLLTQMTVMLSASLEYIDYFPLSQNYYALSTTVKNAIYFFAEGYAIS